MASSKLIVVFYWEVDDIKKCEDLHGFLYSLIIAIVSIKPL